MKPMLDNKKLWDSVLVEMELSLSKPNFNTWFKDTYVLKEEDGEKQQAVILTNKTPATTELPMQDIYINKEDNLNPRYTFESFVVGPFNEFAYAASQAIIKKPGIVYNPLFIYGGTGHGKTHLIQAVGNHIKNTSNRKVF